MNAFTVKIKPANGAYRELFGIQGVFLSDEYGFQKKKCAARDEGVESPAFSHVITSPSTAGGLTFEIRGLCTFAEWLTMRPLFRGDFGFMVGSGGVEKTYPNSQIAENYEFDMSVEQAGWNKDGAPVFPWGVAIFSKDVGD